MINGFSGASASVFKTFLPAPVDGKTFGEGIEYIYPTVILAGCLMVLFGLLRLGDRTINLVGRSLGTYINYPRSYFCSWMGICFCMTHEIQNLNLGNICCL